MQAFGILASGAIVVLLLVVTFMQGIVWFAFILLLLSALLYIDYRLLATPFREINAQIVNGHEYLQSPSNRDLCEKVLRQTGYAGPFTLHEMNVLRKELRISKQA